MNLRPPRTALTLLTLAVAAALAAPSVHAAPQPGSAQTSAATAYVINLESSTVPIRPEDRPDLAPLAGGHRIYVVKVELRGVLWYRLRLGFFATREEAQKVMERLAGQYPDAWLAKAKVTEAEPVAGAKAAPRGAAPAVVPGAGRELAAVEELMNRARESMLVSDYSQAIRLYTKVLELPRHPFSQEAQELLGLARERNGQLAHAKAEYETYLRLYPEGEGAERVRQRLTGLITAREDSPEPLRAARADETEGKWEGFGSFSQYYRWDESTDADVTTTNQSSLISDFDYTARRRGQVYDVRSRFTGQYLHDFTGEQGEEGRISTLYLEALHAGRGFSGIVGRQSRNDSGILGRFDGAVVSKPLSSRTRLNLAAGLPVEFGTEDRINEHKHFLGISLDAGTFAGGWDFNTFYLRQEVDGITDREAVGGEARHATEGRNLFALVDYDLSYSAINTLLALAGWSRPDGTSLNLILDYRKTPVLTTSNALISQTGASTIDEMLATRNESEIRRLAEDRTALSRSATVSLTRPINEKWQVMGDVTVSSITGTPASGGVEASEGTGQENYYSLQFIASDLLKSGDATIFGARYADAQSADTTSFSVNHRYPLSERTYLNPKLRLDLRDNTSGGDETVVAGSLRVTHQYKTDLALEAEIGAEWGQRTLDSGDTRRDNRFVYFGFRKDF